MADNTDLPISGPTRTEDLEPQYTGCHMHSENELFCVGSDGDEVQVLNPDAEDTASGTYSEAQPTSTSPSGENCHFHAGVEHCVGEGQSENGGEPKSCTRVDRNYNIPLRIGLLFVVLVTSAIGVFTPILATSFFKVTEQSIFFVILKQFGAGVVVSTAFIHLFTHANLMFGDPCVGTLQYEATTAAIFTAGLFLSFLLEYLGIRFVLWRNGKNTTAVDGENPAQVSNTKGPSEIANSGTTIDAVSHDSGHGHAVGKVYEDLGVMVLEAGMIFHSIIIGLTLVVAGDSFFLTLFAVIVFHQMFEGIALGTCIAGIPKEHASLIKRLLMGLAYALVTPVGMAIGIGVIKTYNGSDKATLIAFGTLDSFSAGILTWVGLVEMIARDWMAGPLLTAGPLKTSIAMTSLVAGLALMSLLGKWA
ncbi:Zip-domain-containing protein [Lojkania enalia]|uniref:Zip-domain-containing protein n=1 Tax=Lojkania enalia TaxID=147567 RepID=A0A9P4K9F0_9PLEO|nr:Zip-domain-containing protein [Didymosphaeria enalia]